MSGLACRHDGCTGKVAADGFCDTCGRRPEPSTTAPPSAGMPPTAASAGGAPACPSCGAARDTDALFCEACGFDFVKGRTPSVPVARPAFTEEVEVRPAAPPDPPNPATPEPPAEPPAEPAAPAWEAAVETDADWYAWFCETWTETHGEDCPIPFPGSSRRVVAIDGPVVVIGRHAAGIDLALEPNDAAVSHRHASLIRQADDTYALTDLDSSNGTYVDGRPVAKGQTTTIPDDGSFTVGAFTRITLRKTSLGA